MRYLIIAFSVLFASPALALDGTFKVPAVGTEVNYGNWAYTVIGIDGHIVKSRNTSGDEFVNFAHFVTYDKNRWRSSAFSLDRDAIRSIWPLKIGKTTKYDMTGSNGTWRGQLEVVDIETIKTPAGTFECFKVERKRRAVAGNWSDKADLWYSPEVRFIVKWRSETTGGSAYGATTTGSLVSLNRPKNENAQNLGDDGNTDEGQTDSASIDQKLKRLQNLRDKELITEDEYKQKKQRILDKL